MSEHKVTLTWERKTPDFKYETYDRSHTITYGGGESIQASSAPQYMGKAELMNPEEAFCGSLSSCHMLTFLAIAARKKYVVDSYRDEAFAELGKAASGKMVITKVVLRPQVKFSGTVPDKAALEALHHSAHENCFISNSVSCAISVEIKG